MSLPVFRRFAVQDIPNAPDWITQILSPLNIFCETTVSSLNKNLTIGQNVQGMKYTVSFSTGADYLTGTFSPIQFAYTSNGQPNCCILGSITRTDSTTPMLSAVSVVNWQLNINVNPAQVIISYIAGLDINARYTATFLVI